MFIYADVHPVTGIGIDSQDCVLATFQNEHKCVVIVMEIRLLASNVVHTHA
jgi:hypothetical protein